MDTEKKEDEQQSCVVVSDLAKAKGKRVRCDVYETPLASIGYEKICDKFITFLESLNRIRRTNMSHRVKQRHPTTPNDTAVSRLLLGCLVDTIVARPGPRRRSSGSYP
ncbi:hypothetical protein TSMEX_000774 [Taenia solium]|eukprot:TsM_000740400 transcript=TsM_000740400 gene=TsM_000740400